MYLNTIGEKLKKRRKEKGLTQTKLAELSGVSQSMISGLERQKNGKVPGADALVHLAEALEVDFEYFFRKSEDTTLTVKTDKYLDDDKMIDVVPFYSTESVFCEQYLAGIVPTTYRCVSNHLNIDLSVAVSDDAMFPFFLKGDCVFVTKCTQPIEGDVVLFIYRSKACFRRYLKENKTIRFQPFNPVFQEMPVRKENMNDLIIVGKVPFFARFIENNDVFKELLAFHDLRR